MGCPDNCSPTMVHAGYCSHILGAATSFPLLETLWSDVCIFEHPPAVVSTVGPTCFNFLCEDHGMFPVLVAGRSRGCSLE